MAPLLLGSGGPTSGLHLFGEQHGFLLALLPPGAFILLGLGLAWRQSCQATAAASSAGTGVTSGMPGEAAS